MRRRQMLLIAALGLLLLTRSGGAVPVDGSAEIPVAVKYIALTFDDGPRRGTTDQLLDGLRERGASATFFLVGEQAAANPELVRRMQAEGHQVGNHTWGHVRLEGTAPEAAVRQVETMETLLSELLGGEDYWLRPPYGLVSSEVERMVTVPMVKWSVDPRDWESRDAGQVYQAIMESVEANSIILLHDIYPTSVDAALRVVDALQAEGYWFVTVEELLGLNGVTPQPGVLYRTGTGP